MTTPEEEQAPQEDRQRSVSDRDLTLLRAKYPGYSAFKVASGDQVHPDTNWHAWVVLDVFAEDELLVVIDEAPVSKSLSPHRLAIDSTSTQSNYTPDNNWGGPNNNSKDMGVRRHLVVRRQRYLLGQLTGTVVARLTEQVEADKRKLEQAGNDRVAADAALRKANDDLGAAERKLEKEQDERTKQQHSLDQLNADLRGRSVEVALLRAQVKKLREHIGQREFDKLLAEASKK
jgi:hypothetical protein